MKAVIFNSVSLICFTILAIYFNHWWIVLFSLLYMVSEKVIVNKEDSEVSKDFKSDNDFQMRYATHEEQEGVREYVNSISHNTDVNFFDLVNSEKDESK